MFYMLIEHSPRKPKNDRNTPKTYKITKISPKPKKWLKDPLKPIK